MLAGGGEGRGWGWEAGGEGGEGRGGIPDYVRYLVRIWCKLKKIDKNFFSTRSDRMHHR